ncbi:MAG: hypothetical protein HYX53_11455 [Chloroflexi bacterium]|nr:hypothetical protein [Chloroflexota bacterium]
METEIELGPEQVARELYERIQTERAGTVLAVWADGSITVEGYGFFARPHRDGHLRRPLASYPAKTSISYHDVLGRLLDGLREHGLIPPG